MIIETLANFGWREVPVVLFVIALGLVLFLVIRQNEKDYLDLIGALDHESPETRR